MTKTHGANPHFSRLSLLGAAAALVFTDLQATSTRCRVATFGTDDVNALKIRDGSCSMAGGSAMTVLQTQVDIAAGFTTSGKKAKKTAFGDKASGAFITDDSGTAGATTTKVNDEGDPAQQQIQGDGTDGAVTKQAIGGTGDEGQAAQQT